MSPMLVNTTSFACSHTFHLESSFYRSSRFSTLQWAPPEGECSNGSACRNPTRSL